MTTVQVPPDETTTQISPVAVTPLVSQKDLRGRALANAFRRWAFIPILVAGLLASAGWLVGTIAKPSAESLLIVQTDALDSQGMDRDTESAALTLSTATAFERAAQRAGVDVSDLRSRTRIGAQPNTQIVAITVTAPTTQQAVREANAIADSALAAGTERVAAQLDQITDRAKGLIDDHHADNGAAERARLARLGDILATEQTAAVNSAQQLELLQKAEPARSVPSPPLMAAMGAIAGALLGLAAAQFLGVRRGPVISGRELSQLYPEVTVIDPTDLEAVIALEPAVRTVLLAGVRRSGQDLYTVTEMVRRALVGSGREVFVRDGASGPFEPTRGQVNLIPTTLSEAVVRRTERDHRTLLFVLVQPGVTRLEALHPFAPRLTDRTYVMVDHRVLTWE
jgi:hypothetical protein